jgi:hypothetical protein
MDIESPNDSDFLDYFLTVVAEHPSPKLIATINEQGQSLTPFDVAWAAGLSEDVGQYPLISSPSQYINYFIFYAKSTGLTGYLSFYPSIC